MGTPFAFIKDCFSKEHFKPTIILLYVVFAVTLWKYIPAAEPFADTAGHRLVHLESVSAATFFSGSIKLFAAFVLMGVIPILIVKFVFREKLTDYGLSLGIPLRTFRTMAIVVPMMAFGGWLASGNTAFYVTYPYNPYASVSWSWFTVHAIMYLVLFYFSWEFLFRGFVLKGLEPTCGVVNAVMIQTVFSAMLHYGFAGVEVFSSIFAGILWGYFALRTRSILSGCIQHYAIGIILDLFLILNLK